MIADLIFQSPHSDGAPTQPSMWLLGAAAITAGYILFALVLVGVPQFARGGVVFTMLGFGWLGLGVLLKTLIFPKILWLPTAFFLMVVISGVFMPAFPLEYMGMMTTIWVGSIVLAAFVANGVSLYLIIAGFGVVFLANLAAIAVGYDGYYINKGATTASLQLETFKRKTGLAGQANLLAALTFTFPFLLFLVRRSLGVVAYAVGVGACLCMMFLTGSRSTVAFSAIFIVLGSVFFIKGVVLRVLLVVVGATSIMVLSSVMSNSELLARIELSPLGEITIVKRVIAGMDGVDQSAEIRRGLATQFWPKYFEKPAFGYGPAQFSEVAGDGVYAHNNFAEIAINWGAIGLLLYYSLYVVALYGIIKYLPIDYRMIAPMIFLAVADFAFVTFLERPMVLCLCLMLVTLFHNRPEPKRRRRRRRHSSSSDGDLVQLRKKSNTDRRSNSFDDDDFEGIGVARTKSNSGATTTLIKEEHPLDFDFKT